MIEATAPPQTSSAPGVSSPPVPPRPGMSPNLLPSGDAPASTDRPAKSAALLARVEVDKETGCWLWTGGKTGNGYARWHDARTGLRHRAHRLMYELYRGPIPENLVTDHLCRVRHCVNPWHLELVTNRENILRGESPSAVNARKTHCEQGHPFTPENTALYPGERRCRECRRIWRAAAAGSAAPAPAVTSWNASAALSRLALVYDRTDLTFREMDELKVAIEKRAGINVRLCDFCSRAHAALITESFMRICGQCLNEGRA